MAVSQAQMAVIRRWFLAPTHVPSKAVADALEAILNAATLAEALTLDNLMTETGDLLLTEGGDPLAME